MAKKRYNFTIYSDASYDPELKLATASYIIIDHRDGNIRQNTRIYSNLANSAQAELRGIIDAVDSLPSGCGPYHVICDCESIIKSLNSLKDANFLATSPKAEQLNLSLDDVVKLKKTKSKNISFSWAPGHAGEVFNTIVDRASRRVLREEKERKLSGVSLFEDIIKDFASISSEIAENSDVTAYA